MFYALILFCLASCSALWVPRGGTPASGDAGDTSHNAEKACYSAELRLAELDCKGPDGGTRTRSPGGVPFSTACTEAYADGRDWRADCIALVGSCAEVDTAYRTPKGQPCRD